jgi:hypothetical protein
VQSQEQAAAARRQEGRREGKPIKGTGGVSAASTDPDQVTAWWKKWPQALIGLACGHPTKGTETPAQPAGLPLFVLDFDPRTDPTPARCGRCERLKARDRGAARLLSCRIAGGADAERRRASLPAGGR